MVQNEDIVAMEG